MVFTPIWHYDTQYVDLTPDDSDDYCEISEKQATVMAQRAGITWTPWGGKILLGAVALLAIVGIFIRDDEDEEGTAEKAEQ